jgi:small-conductance mechanosensitive channel
MQPLLKSRQWLTVAVLFLLLLAAGIGAFLTRDARLQELAATPSARAPVVDERPLQTARDAAKLSSSWDEQRFANQALRVADHEVDLAFADALREASSHPVRTPQAQALYARLNQAQQQADRDQDHVNQLKKDVAAANGARQDQLQDQLDLAQAQLELDQDEVDSAKTDLIRSGVDKFSRVQRQFQRHEDADHTADASHLTTPSATPINYHADHLLGQIEAWQALRSKCTQLEKAESEAAEVAASLNQAHSALEQRIAAEKSGASQSTSSSPQPQSVTPTSSAPTVAGLKALSEDQKTLADYGKRMQDMQEAQAAYGNWVALVVLHQRAVVHGMIESALWILLIVIVVYFADRFVDRYLAKTAGERTRMHTLRVVIRFTVQAIGVLMILLVILGMPQQMPTILGFAGAGLTVALKDFIVAFFGWFVLMGKNGLRVGDWVEIDGVSGEVIEINLLRTVLLETGNWNGSGHPTGRKVAFVNSYAIEGHFFNFTTSGQWLWDELQMMIPSDVDPYPLLDQIKKAVTAESEANVHAAEQEWQRAASHYHVQSVSAAPSVNLQPTLAGLEVHVRYITRAQERAAMRSRLSQTLVQLLRGKGTVSAAQPA